MPYIPTTDAERARMLEFLGIRSVDELFADLPPQVRLARSLDLPEAMDEASLMRHMRGLADANTHLDETPSFLGGGAYDHLTPAALRTAAFRSEFLTAYTPYQAEISQGMLQSIYEFQTLICQLTDLDVSNASVYDGATALAEAAIMAANATNRSRVLLSEGIHPEHRAVTETYLRHQGVEIETIPLRGGTTDLDALRDAAGGGAAAVCLQHPNFFGALEEVDAWRPIADEAGALLIASVDPISLGLLKPPGAYGADIAVGEGQSLGNAVSFGGPYLGFIAARQGLLRRLPGRIVGRTADAEGNPGFVLTLQAREQHIRRERASSNICTNQALNALMATVFLCLAGKEGLREAAWLSAQKARYAFDRLRGLPGFEPAFSRPFFKEFTLRCRRNPEELNAILLERGIIGGLPLGRFGEEWKDAWLLCVTEARTREEIDRLAEILEGVGADA